MFINTLKQLWPWYKAPSPEVFINQAPHTKTKTVYVQSGPLIKETVIKQCQVYRANRPEDIHDLIIVKEESQESYKRVKRGLESMLKIQSKYLVNVNSIFANSAKTKHENHLCATVQHIEGKKRLLDAYATAELHKNNHTNFNLKVAKYMIHAFRGLEDMHAQNMVHRGISLSSLVFGDKDQVYLESYLNLKSFYVLQNPDMTFAKFTQDEIIYWSPEFIKINQNNDDSNDETYEKAIIRHIETYKKSDIYALGIVMYKLLTTEFPITSSNSTREALEKEICSQNEFDSPQNKLENLKEKDNFLKLADKELYRICSKAIAKDPQNRYDSAAEAIQELEFVYNKYQRKKKTTKILNSGLILGTLGLAAVYSPINFSSLVKSLPKTSFSHKNNNYLVVVETSKEKSSQKVTSSKQETQLQKIEELRDPNKLIRTGIKYQHGRAGYPQDYGKALQCYERGHNYKGKRGERSIQSTLKYTQLLLNKNLPSSYKKDITDITNMIINRTQYGDERMSKLTDDEKKWMGSLYNTLGSLQISNFKAPKQEEVRTAVEYYVKSLQYKALGVNNNIAKLYQDNLITPTDESKYPILYEIIEKTKETSNYDKAIAYFEKSRSEIRSSGEYHNDLLGISNYNLGILYLNHPENKDETQGISYLKEAAKQGFINSYFALGKYYSKDNQSSKKEAYTEELQKIDIIENQDKSVKIYLMDK